ncbi:MAG: hypothetical protein RBR24_09590 [Candidatus Carbobacillus sp.]|nr:hypothetical protein [Candidatus Carbobacillus sp.]
MKGFTLVELLAAFLLVSVISFFAFTFLYSGQHTVESLTSKTKSSEEFERTLLWLKRLTQTAIQMTATDDGLGFDMTDANGQATHVRLVPADTASSTHTSALLCAWEHEDLLPVLNEQVSATLPEGCTHPFPLTICQVPDLPAKPFQNDGASLLVTLQCAHKVQRGYLYPLTR